MRVLDLGCGDGLTPDKLGLPSDWQIIGIDVQPAAVAKAHSNFPRRMFVCSAAEKLPFTASSFDRVISNVELRRRFVSERSETLVCGSHEAVAFPFLRIKR
jgi:ubiquinone/menaquinone biosynthesis C-methylase UbiE